MPHLFLLSLPLRPPVSVVVSFWHTNSFPSQVPASLCSCAWGFLQHLVQFAWLQNWEEVHPQEQSSINGEWGSWSNTPSFQLISSHSWGTFCKVSQSIPSGTRPTLSTAAAHHWCTWYCLVSHPSPFSYSLTGASQDHLPNKLHKSSPCLRAYLWEN